MDLKQIFKNSGWIKESEGKLPNNPEGPGIIATHWFWASMQSLASHAPAKKEEIVHNKSDADQDVRDILTQHSDMNAATLYNTLKSKGIQFVKDETKDQKQESDSASANTASTRAGVNSTDTHRKQKKESQARAFNLIESFRVKESSARDNGVGYTKFETILIQEGLGNLKDAYYYTKEAINSAIPVFEGKKIYADHPSLAEEETRPERSVRDVLGHFENVRVIEADDGRLQLVGDVNILPDKPYEWARGLMRHAVDYSDKYPDKDFIGLSINANGDAEEAELESFLKENESNIPASAIQKLKLALEQGVTTVKLVSAIQDAISCDLVTEAGAGGRINKYLEGDQEMKKTKESVKESEKKHSEDDAMDKKDMKDMSDDKDQKDMKHDDEKGKEEKKEDGAAEDHADEEQDMELIKSMLDKYLGKESYGEAEMKHAHAAMKCAMKHGDEQEEAMKCAGYAMKMARHMAAEEKAKESDMEHKKEAHKEDEAHKESAAELDKVRADMLKLKGENAALKESLKTKELEDHLDIELKKLALPRERTKDFREALGKLRSKEQIDKEISLIKMGIKLVEDSRSTTYNDLFIEAEKASEPNSEVSYSDCAE